MKRKAKYLMPVIEIYPLCLGGKICLQGSEVSSVSKEKMVQINKQSGFESDDTFTIDDWD